MKKYDNKYGFSVTKATYISDIDSTLVDMKHDKSGARLLFLDREDENKTFAISFKTVPSDDTGVFHILEHSVLCGSEKFPVKDPLTELIKGSVSTYINAMTYGERTVYPVSGKNDKALLGLVDVYLDAVLHPNALKHPYIFMQEGCRYEINDGKLELNGVVYNEMKGVYSSADEYADYLITKLISPGSAYSYDSGGNPDFIPSLSYEDFKAAHEKFYHPSNATLFLDGSVDLDGMLPLIDSYLKDYDERRENIEIYDGDAPITEPCIKTYPTESGEDSKDKNRIYLCYNTYHYSEREKNIALSLAAESIADSNDAALTKKLVGSGLCESFSLYPTRSYSLNALNAIFIGVKDGCEEELIALYEESLKEILNAGIPEENLDSAIRRLEFNTREADYGSYPKGMVYMGSVTEAATMGIDPALRLEYSSTFAFLREKINTGYFVELLREVTSTPRATLILHPDEDFNKKREDELERILKEKYDEMSPYEREKIINNTHLFNEWQGAEDSDEDLEKIPTITIEDLDTALKKTPTEVMKIEGCEVISHPIHTGGISYVELFFDVSDIPCEDIPYLRLFTELMGEWATVNGDATRFRNQVKKYAGMFHISPQPIKNGNDARLYLVMRISCLDADKSKVRELISEHLYDTLINDEDILKKNAKQIYTASYEYITARGDGIAMMRDTAKHSSYDAMNETLFGYSYHVFIKNLCENLDTVSARALEKLSEIRSKYLVKERLTAGITEPRGEDFVRSIILTMRHGEPSSGASKIHPLEPINEGIAIPSTVSFAARTANINTLGGIYTGAFATLCNIASYEILWNEIRLKGGAYDTGFFARSGSGAVGCYSFRDPSPERSVEVFASLHEYINELIEEAPDLTKYIIGTIGAIDTVNTPRSEGSSANIYHLSGRSYEDRLRVRREILSTTTDDLARISDILKRLAPKSTVTAVAPREVLEKMGIDRILEI